MRSGDSVFKNTEECGNNPIVLVPEDSIVPLIPDCDQRFSYVKGTEVRDSKSSDRFLQDYSVPSAVPNVIEES